MIVFESPHVSLCFFFSFFNPDKQSVFCYLKELLKPCSICSDADRVCAMSCLAVVNSCGSNHMTTAVVQSLSCVRLFATPWTATRQASVSLTISRSLLQLLSTEAVMPSTHLTLSCPLLLLSSVFPSIRVFPHELALQIRWPKNWSLSFLIHPSNEYSGLTSFRIDLFDLLAVLGTLKSLLQHHSLKASMLQHSVFFMVQLSHPYMTTGKTTTWTVQTIVGKVLSLLFNTLSRFVIAFLLRSKRLLILWLQSPSPVILVVV